MLFNDVVNTKVLIIIDRTKIIFNHWKRLFSRPDTAESLVNGLVYG